MSVRKGNKLIYINSPLIVDKITRNEYKKYKTYASAVDFPVEKQKDLMYFKAVFVSSGTNKNAITFLPSELIKARNTIPHKAVDYEHEEDNVIGHIYSHAFVTPDGKEIDAELLVAGEGSDWASQLDKLDMDIVVAGVLYRSRFPEIAKELDDNEWYLSMEAFFEDFDFKVGEVIIPRLDAGSLGITEANIGTRVKVKASTDRDYHDSLVSRVIRNILFSGAGLVKDPANPNSVFLETASVKDVDFPEEGIVVDLSEYSTPVDLTIEKVEGIIKENKVVAKKVIEKFKSISNLLLIKIEGDDSDVKFKVVDSFIDWSSANKKLLELMAKEGGTKFTIVDYFRVFSDFDEKSTMEEILEEENVRKIYDINDKGEVVAIFRVVKDLSNSNPEFAATYTDSPPAPFDWSVPNLESGPEHRRTITEGLCVNFKKYLYERTGATDQGQIVQEHWCTLFDESCPVIGASAKDPTCLRNTKNRPTRYEEDNTMFGDTVRLTRSETAGVSVGVKEQFNKLAASIGRANELVGNKPTVTAAKWTRKFINTLPNASFAFVEKDVGTKAGRHLPHHGSSGGGTKNTGLDLSHLRNALARANQVKPAGKISQSELRKKLLTHLNKHKSALKSAKVKASTYELHLITEIESLYTELEKGAKDSKGKGK